MPWECKTVEKQRLEFVTKALETNNFSALCREYEITRKTGSPVRKSAISSA